MTDSILHNISGLLVLTVALSEEKRLGDTRLEFVERSHCSSSSDRLEKAGQRGLHLFTFDLKKGTKRGLGTIINPRRHSQGSYRTRNSNGGKIRRERHVRTGSVTCEAKDADSCGTGIELDDRLRPLAGAPARRSG